MQTTDKTKIKNAINAFVEVKGISKSDLATQLNISSATLSNIEHERWDMLKDEMLLKIWNIIKPSSWSYVNTSNYESVIRLCRDVKTTKKMVGLIGYTGAGKTTALFEFYRNTSNTWYLQGKKSMKPKRLFEKLLKQMGVNYSGTIYDMIERVAIELNAKVNPLLIIDEAGKLDQTMLMYLHDLRNETEDTTGIILAGVEYFQSNLKKAVDKQKQGMPEFYSRIESWQFLGHPTSAEIRAICQANGLTDPDVIKGLLRLKDYRQVANQIRNELLIIEAGKKILEPEGVLQS